MRCFFLFVCLLLTRTPLAQAEEAAPLPEYFHSAEKVCLARITAVDGYKITFTVTEIFRGKPDHVITVTRAGGAENYTLNSEWLLESCSYGLENSVGWDEDRPAAWIPGAVIRQGDKVYFTDWTARIPTKDKEIFGITWDFMPDGTRCLTLDHIKQLLKDHPYKP